MALQCRYCQSVDGKSASIDISGVEDPFFYPGRGDLPKNMPRSIIVSAEYDPLRDDGEAYAAALKEAGCDVNAIRAKGMMHGFLLYWHKFDAARELIESIPVIVGLG